MTRHDNRRFAGGRAAATATALLGLWLAAVPTAMAATAARAADGALAAAERQVLGDVASTDWHRALGRAAAGDDTPGSVPDEFGSARRDRVQSAKDAPPGRLGRQFKAGLLSAVLPGAGQFYNGHRQRAYLMAGTEAGIWRWAAN